MRINKVLYLSSNTNYRCTGWEPDLKTYEKDLEILIDHELDWSQHCDIQLRNAHKKTRRYDAKGIRFAIKRPSFLYWPYHLLTRWSWVNFKTSHLSTHKWEYLPHRVVNIKWSEKYERVIYNSKDICRYYIVINVATHKESIPTE